MAAEQKQQAAVVALSVAVGALAAVGMTVVARRRRRRGALRSTDGRPTILITGTTGWLGKLLAERLLASGDVRVLGLARRASGIEGVIDIRADLATGVGLDVLAHAGRIDACVHLSGVAGWCGLDEGLEVNVLGTRRLMTALAPVCKKFVVASSIAAVGTGVPDHPPHSLPIPDSHPYAGYPWPYAFSKYQAEELCRFLVAKDEHKPDLTRFGVPDDSAGQ